MEAFLQHLGQEWPKVEGYVFSADPDVDGLQMTIEEAQSAHDASDRGAVVSVVPGKLAYYCPESPEGHYILFRE